MLFHAGVIAAAASPFTTVASYTKPGTGKSIYLAENPVTKNIYICGSQTVTILNPVTMTAVGSVTDGTLLAGVSGGDFSDDGTRFYAACETRRSVAVINCSNETAPTIVNSVQQTASNLGGASYCQRDGNVLIVTCISAGNCISFMTISGDTLTFVAKYTGNGTNTVSGSRRCVLDRVNKRAFCAQDSFNANNMGLCILDYSNPASPTLVAFDLNTLLQTWRGAYFDPRGYLVTVSGKDNYYDVSALPTLTLVATVSRPAGSSGGSTGGSRSNFVKKIGDRYYVVKTTETGGSLILLDVTDLNRPVNFGSIAGGFYEGPFDVMEPTLTPGYLLSGNFTGDGDPTVTKTAVVWPSA